MSVYVAAVGKPATTLLARILCDTLRADVRVEENSTRSGAIGLGSTLLSPAYEQPVTVVLDANTLEEGPLEEQRSTVEHLLWMGSSGAPFRLVLAVPQVEAVLFADRAGLERALGRAIADDDFFEARFRPKAVFKRLVGEDDGEERARAVIDRLDHAALVRMAQHPLIQEIAAFVEEVASHGEREEPLPVRRAG